MDASFPTEPPNRGRPEAGVRRRWSTAEDVLEPNLELAGDDQLPARQRDGPGHQPRFDLHRRRNLDLLQELDRSPAQLARASEHHAVPTPGDHGVLGDPGIDRAAEAAAQRSEEDRPGF